MSSVAIPDAAPPVARWPRWGRPVLLAVTLALLAAAVVVSTRQTLYLFVPVALLAALYCARLGVQRGRAPEAGTLPGWCGFGMLMLLSTPPDPADAPALGLLLLACFAVLRADPPTPGRVGFGWTVAAGAIGMGSVCGGANTLGGVAALIAYAGWSAGGWRATGFALGAAASGAMIRGWVDWRHNAPGGLFLVASFLLAAMLGLLLRRWTTDPLAPPVAHAHRVIGLLLFVALAGLPVAFFGSVKFVALPLVLAAGLLLTVWSEGHHDPAARSESLAATPPPPSPVPPR